MSKYIFVIGGVMSGVGKGTAAASIGKILQAKGFRVTAIKIDPYINVDAGTMNPTEHGEVFVTDDGDETDQDIGNYERFLDTNIYRDNYMTTGRVYQTVIQKERNLDYGGRCVEVVPHVPLEIIRRIKKVSKSSRADFIIIEIGGTVGEYQNILFLEAARMMHLEKPQDVVFILVSYLPIPSNIGEMKTKPTQYAARSLNSAGIQPDFIIARAEEPLDEPRKRKISVFCNIDKNNVISSPNVDSVYEVPLVFEEEKFSQKILSRVGLRRRSKDLKEWRQLVKIIKTVEKPVKIGIVGKYFGTGDFILSDSYISVIEAIKHASWYHRHKPIIEWLDAEEYEKDSVKLKKLAQYNGVIVPGGFGERGVEGKILAVQYVRENKIPYLGLCYGLQMAVIEIARHLAGLKEANTTEVNRQTPHPVIHIMPEQIKNIREQNYGATMRLGAWPCFLEKGTISREAYSKRDILERHRHRYEFNNDYREILKQAGLVLAGFSPDKKLVEVIELPQKIHPFFVGTQFHPELKSRPLRPHPLFREFIKASIKTIS